MNAGEILSLQFGHYSNFIGTHWWNIQETSFDYSNDTKSEINHDVLFREGLTNKKEITYTPRLLLVDLKGSLRTLREQSDLYDEPSPLSLSPLPDLSTIPWLENKIQLVTDEKGKFEKNNFQKSLETQSELASPSETDVKVWSDFLYTRFHPRTVNVINEYTHGTCNENAFDIFPLGTNLWKQRLEYNEEFSDKIRAYIEECDHLQGFHVIADGTNAFGGFASSCLQHIRDEYDRKSILTFPTIPSYYSDYNFTNAKEREESTRNDSIRLINWALCLESLTEYSSLTVPLCAGSKGWRQPGPGRQFPHLNYNIKLPYHSSAILASALDTFTLPYRLKSARLTIDDFNNSLNYKIAAASVSLPFTLKSGEYLIDCLDNWSGPLWQCLTPNCTIQTDKSMQLMTIRGVPESRLKEPLERARRQREMAAYKCENVQEMLSFYLACNSHGTANHVTSVTEPMSVKTPFPNIFDQFVGPNGNISQTPINNIQNVQSVPVLAGCHSGSSIGDMLEILHRETKRIKISRFHQFRDAGLETDDFNESLNQLLNLRECYQQSFE